MSLDPTHALFEPLEPFENGFLPEMDGHHVYFEQCGHPQGLPVVFLHGGPGSGCSAKHRQLFNPKLTRVILFDQRGCGRSTSTNYLMHNQTQVLLMDIERLRIQLGISKWLVVGGSWGGGLGLAYASAYPEACLGLVLRGVFLSRPADLNWFFQGARVVMPDAWSDLAASMPAAFKDDIGSYLYDCMAHADDAAVLPLAQAWQAWENALTQRTWTPATPVPLNDADAAQLVRKYRLQSHYLQQQCFFPAAGLLSQLSALASVPLHLVHGRLDWICRPESAWAVHQALPHSQLQWVDNAGHNLFEPAMLRIFMQVIATVTEKNC